ncbi:MAG: beta-galactosidase [Ruthenibacterium sp.]
MIYKAFLMGADYNPEQWLASPEILEQDIALMQKAGCNVMTMGMFAWPFLEPSEGNYQMDWLKSIVDKLYAAGIYTMLGTPSGARPRWLAQKYPELLRVDSLRRRQLFGERQNHCFTAPAYREKVFAIDTELAKTFGKHPGVLLWHLSNEYAGECHCPLCQEAFRDWVRKKYVTLDALNAAWSTAFWAHTYTDWSQIESPSPLGDSTLHSLQLDWRRFCCDQTIAFMENETAAIRSVCPEAKVTTNMMYYTYDLNYFKLAQKIDLAAWDNYPVWHSGDDAAVAADTAMYHDLMRSVKHAPFLLMESAPSVTNWQGVARQKRPGMNLLSSLQAVAHGADSVQFFQWRQSVGNSEKFHGAILDHSGKEDTRVFKEIAELGSALQQLGPVCGSTTKADVAVLFDWENRWAIAGAKGPFSSGTDYKDMVQKHYDGLWAQGVSVDFADMESTFSSYRLVIAPLLHLLRADIAEKLRAFVAQGGTLVTGPYSGVVDENDRCFLGGTPHALRDVLGLRTVELDGLHAQQQVRALPAEGSTFSLPHAYACTHLCEVVECDTATPVLCYDSEYYKGAPALTVASFGKGKAYYVCTELQPPFYRDFYSRLLAQCGIARLVPFAYPPCVEVSSRAGGGKTYLFVQNFSEEACPFLFSELLQSGWTLMYGNADEDTLTRYGTVVLCSRQG